MKINWIKIHDECEHYKKILKPSEDDTLNFIATIKQLTDGDIDLSGVNSLYGFIESYLRKLVRLNQHESASKLTQSCIDTIKKLNQRGLSPTPKTRWPLAIAMLNSLQNNFSGSIDIIESLIGDSIGSKENTRLLLALLIKQQHDHQVLQLLIRATKQNLNNQHALVLSDPIIQTWYKTDPDIQYSLDKVLQEYESQQTKYDNPKNYADAIEAAYDFLQRPFLELECKTNRIIVLLNYIETIPNDIFEDFIEQSFTLTKTMALRTGSLVNTSIYNSLLRLTGYWILKKANSSDALCDILIRECWFVIFDENRKLDDSYNPSFPIIHKNNLREWDLVSRHYELNCLAGTISLQLANFNRPEALEVVNCFVETFIENYSGESFVMKGLYTKWIMTQDGNSALEFIQNQENAKGLAYAITAVADLDFKAGLEPICDLTNTIDNELTQEVCKEAIERLRKQTHPGAISDRMIHLFGSITPTEIALGAETDNQFILRARKNKQNAELYTIYETDQSDLNDR